MLFTPLRRGGSGPPLLCLHGFAATWRTLELVLPMLEREHDVLAPTLAGHAGGPPIDGEIHVNMLADGIERTLDEAGWAAHVVGSSLGAYVACDLYTTTRFEHIPAELLVHQIRGAAACESGLALIEHAHRVRWPLDAERIECPVRIVWGTEDRILPRPAPRPATATGSPVPTGWSSTA